MIGVAEDDVGAAGAHLLRPHRLDRRRGPDRHERRGADFARAAIAIVPLRAAPSVAAMEKRKRVIASSA